MESVTEKELLVLKAICENEYRDDDEVIVGVPIWYIASCDTRIYGIEGKELSGVCSSLSKKGFMGADGKGKDGRCWITEEGFKVLRENLLKVSDLKEYLLKDGKGASAYITLSGERYLLNTLVRTYMKKDVETEYELVEEETELELPEDKDRRYIAQFNYGDHWCFFLPRSRMYMQALDKVKKDIQRSREDNDRRGFDCEYRIVRFIEVK